MAAASVRHRVIGVGELPEVVRENTSSKEEYREFVAGYGFDVMSWPGYTLLRDVRELIMVTWLAQNSWHLPEIAAEVSKRIADLRGGNAR